MRAASALLVAALISGCSGDKILGPEGGSITLSISSTEVMTSAGDTRSVTAVVKDARNIVIPSPTVAWSTSAPSVATVSGSGAGATITAVDDGTATITAAEGAVRDTVTVTVRRALASVDLQVGEPSLIPGATTDAVGLGLDARGNLIESVTSFTYESSNPTSVIVSSSGQVTALFNPFVTQGATITATATRDGVTFSGSAAIGVDPPPASDYATVMLAENVEPNPVPTSAVGAATFSLNGAGMSYRITWSGFSGPSVGVHLHGPAGPADVADVLIDLTPGTGSSQTSDHGLLLGSFTAADIHSQGGNPSITLDSLITLMSRGDVYADVHTALHPEGEVRGRVSGPLRPPSPIADVPLREIVLPGFPAPFYHFEYDATGRVTFASYASDLHTYDIHYEGNRISDIDATNFVLADPDQLTYFYDETGNVSMVTYADGEGAVYVRIHLTYAGGRLVKLERERMAEGSFQVDKQMFFVYEVDGNLAYLTDHRLEFPARGQIEQTFVYHFERYDNGINVEGFSLIHNEFFDHLVLLPGVRFQLGNPAEVTQSGSDPNYHIDYTYTYDAENRPLRKHGEGVYLNGTDAGERFQADSRFSYE